MLAPDEGIAREYLAAGATFVAVGTDVGLLGTAARKLLSTYKAAPERGAATKPGGY